MARNRMIKVEFWDDEKIGKLSFGARLLFIGSWNFADDTGVCRANPQYLKAKIFPYDTNLSLGQIGRYLAEIEASGMIKRLDFHGESYFSIKNWVSHQRVNRPSEFRHIKNNEDADQDSQQISAPSLTKVKVKEKEKEKEKEKGVNEPSHARKFIELPGIDYVQLTEPEHTALIDLYGEKIIEDYVQRLELHMGSTGATYLSHYKTIQKWLSRDGVKIREKPTLPCVDCKRLFFGLKDGRCEPCREKYWEAKKQDPAYNETVKGVLDQVHGFLGKFGDGGGKV